MYNRNMEDKAGILVCESEKERERERERERENQQKTQGRRGKIKYLIRSYASFKFTRNLMKSSLYYEIVISPILSLQA